MKNYLVDLVPAPMELIAAAATDETDVAEADEAALEALAAATPGSGWG